jgi:hypothetical protein
MTPDGVGYLLALVAAGLVVYLTETGEVAWQDFRRWRMARQRRR